MRRLLALVAALLLLGAPSAAAHDVAAHDVAEHGAGSSASDLSSVVVRADLPPGVTLTVEQNGQGLRLDNGSGADVAVLADDAPATVVPPGGLLRWHDGAAHPDPATTGADRTVRSWRVELLSAGRSYAVDGEVRWSPGPSPLPWAAAALAIAAVGAVLARRRPRAVALLLGGAVLASAAHTAAELAARTAEGPRWALLGGYLPLAACWVLGAGGAALLARERRDAAWAAALSAAGLLVAALTGDVAVLGASTVVVALPADVDRALVALGAGLAAASLVAAPLLARATAPEPAGDSA